MQSEKALKQVSDGTRSGVLVRIFRTTALILTGLIAGSAATILFINVGTDFLERSIIIGVVAGISSLVLFLLLRVFVLSVAEAKLERSLSSDEASERLARVAHAISSRVLAGRNAAPEELKSVQELLPTVFRTIVSAGSAWLATSATLALMVALAGAVVSLGTVVVAYRQIERLDQQNGLIEQQIFEAKATRISSVFAAQLSGLLNEIDQSRPKDSSSRWEVSPDLAARIQAVVNLAEPYAPDDVVSAWKVSLREKLQSRSEPSSTQPSPYDRISQEEFYAQDVLYSPERGQLLILLLATRFPFDTLSSPLDFSFADLRGLKLAPGGHGPDPLADLGETILRQANLRDAIVLDVDFSRADLHGAILPRPASLSQAIFIHSPVPRLSDFRSFNWLDGARLSHAIMDIADASSRIAVVEGGLHPLGLAGTSDVPAHRLWKLEDYELFMVLREDPIYMQAIGLVRRLLTQAGAVSLETGDCSQENLSSLNEAREIIGGGDTFAAKYALHLLGEFDPTFKDCVLRK